MNTPWHIRDIANEWVFESAQLKCIACGQIITQDNNITEWFHGELNKMEGEAERLQGKHKCGQRHITTEEAKVIMHLYRENNPGLSFEEECKVYNEIMQNQTYL